MFQTLAIIIRAPMGWKCLTKEGIRDKRVQILGAQHEDARWFCGCPDELPSTNKPIDRRLWPAGQRWTKKHVPGEPDPRTQNPAPAELEENPFDPWKEATGV